MSESKFIKAYDDLMALLYETMDDTLHSVADAMDIAKEKTSELGGLTQEEINQVSDYLLRDIEHAAAENDSDSLSQWFKFDLKLIESFALDTFSSLTNTTRVELAKIERQAKKYHPYSSGDIVSQARSFVPNVKSKLPLNQLAKYLNVPIVKRKLSLVVDITDLKLIMLLSTT